MKEATKDAKISATNDMNAALDRITAASSGDDAIDYLLCYAVATALRSGYSEDRLRQRLDKLIVASRDLTDVPQEKLRREFENKSQ